MALLRPKTAPGADEEHRLHPRADEHGLPLGNRLERVAMVGVFTLLLAVFDSLRWSPCLMRSESWPLSLLMAEAGSCLTSPPQREGKSLYDIVCSPLYFHNPSFSRSGSRLGNLHGTGMKLQVRPKMGGRVASLEVLPQAAAAESPPDSSRGLNMTSAAAHEKGADGSMYHRQGGGIDQRRMSSSPPPRGQPQGTTSDPLVVARLLAAAVAAGRSHPGQDATARPSGRPLSRQGVAGGAGTTVSFTKPRER